MSSNNHGLMGGFELTSAALTHRGKKRKNNEDSIGFSEPNDVAQLKQSGCLYLVADGVGGAAYGERASSEAVGLVSDQYYLYPELEPGERLRRLMREAGNKINDDVSRNPNIRQMATTMVAAVIRGPHLTLANVGDSRAYLIHGGKAKLLTQDHTVVEEMVRNGQMTREQANRSRIRHRLSRSLGGERDVKVDVFKDIRLQSGDRLLMCSDGLTRYTTAKELGELCSQGQPEEVTKKLVNLANQRGGADNISAILVDVGAPAEVSGAVVKHLPAVPVVSDPMAEMETAMDIPIIVPPASWELTDLSTWRAYSTWLAGTAALAIILLIVGVMGGRALGRNDSEGEIATTETTSLVAGEPTSPAVVQSTETATSLSLSSPQATNTPQNDTTPTAILSPTPETPAYCRYSTIEGEIWYEITLKKLKPIPIVLEGMSHDEYALLVECIEPNPCRWEHNKEIICQYCTLVFPKVNPSDCENAGGIVEQQ